MRIFSEEKKKKTRSDVNDSWGSVNMNMGKIDSHWLGGLQGC